MKIKVPHKVSYDGDEYFFDSYEGAIQDAGISIITDNLWDYIDNHDATPKLKGVVAQMYQDAKIGNWQSVYDAWRNLVGDNNFIWIDEVSYTPYKRKTVKEKDISYLMDYFKNEQ